jgi:hypothetical protein
MRLLSPLRVYLSDARAENSPDGARVQKKRKLEQNEYL